MPPAYFVAGEANVNLVGILTSHLRSQGQRAAFAAGVDIVVNETRVLRADMAYMTPDDKARQAEAGRAAGKTDPRRTRILVPPTLVIESVSSGHERHDERTKRRWYAEFGVPNYWLLNVFDRTLHCLLLAESDYRDDASGRENDVVQPSAFPGLRLLLASIWPA